MLGASQAGFEGPELTPDGGCTIQPSSAVAVVESISVSVGRAKSHRPPHFPVLAVTLLTLGSHPSRFFLTAHPPVLQTTCPIDPASSFTFPLTQKPSRLLESIFPLYPSLCGHPYPPANHISLSCPSFPGGGSFSGGVLFVFST